MPVGKPTISFASRSGGLSRRRSYAHLGQSREGGQDARRQPGVGALGGGFANTGSNNTASGFDALLSNTTGDNNTASGVESLLNNTSGSNNIALGNSAGSNLTAGSNNIDIGNMGVANESNTIRIGTAGTQTATFIAGVRGVPIAGRNGNRR